MMKHRPTSASMHLCIIMNIYLLILLFSPVSAQRNYDSISAVVGASLGSAIAVFLVLIILYLAYWERCCRKRYSSPKDQEQLAEAQTQFTNNKDEFELVNEKEPGRTVDDDMDGTGGVSDDEKEALKLQIKELKEKDSEEIADLKRRLAEAEQEKQNVSEKVTELLLEKQKLEHEVHSQNVDTSDEIPVATSPPLVKMKSRDDVRFTSGWGRTVKLLDLVRSRLITESRIIEIETEQVSVETVASELHQYLVGDYPIAGLYKDETGETLSLYDAFQKKIVSRGTALSLLEAQAATGSIIDPVAGSKMSVENAQKQGLVDRGFAAVLKRAERAVTGYTLRGSKESLSLFSAMQQELVVEKHGIRLLEAQIATGGIIDPISNHRVPLNIAMEKGLFDERLNATLDDPSDDTKGFLDPNTGENLTYLQLMQRCVIDPVTKFPLLPLVKEDDKKQYAKGKLRDSLRRRISRVHSQVQEPELQWTEEHPDSPKSPDSMVFGAVAEE